MHNCNLTSSSAKSVIPARSHAEVPSYTPAARPGTGRALRAHSQLAIQMLSGLQQRPGAHAISHDLFTIPPSTTGRAIIATSAQCKDDEVADKEPPNPSEQPGGTARIIPYHQSPTRRLISSEHVATSQPTATKTFIDPLPYLPSFHSYRTRVTRSHRHIRLP